MRLFRFGAGQKHNTQSRHVPTYRGPKRPQNTQPPTHNRQSILRSKISLFLHIARDILGISNAKRPLNGSMKRREKFAFTSEEIRISSKNLGKFYYVKCGKYRFRFVYLYEDLIDFFDIVIYFFYRIIRNSNSYYSKNKFVVLMIFLNIFFAGIEYQIGQTLPSTGSCLVCRCSEGGSSGARVSCAPRGCAPMDAAALTDDPESF